MRGKYPALLLLHMTQAAFRGQRLSTKVAESSARNFSELFRVGADLQITYDWRVSATKKRQVAGDGQQAGLEERAASDLA